MVSHPHAPLALHHLTPVSPFCYVGQRKMNAALKKFEGKAKFEVTWHPFYLDPSLPVEGRTKMEYWYGKFGKEHTDASFPMTDRAGMISHCSLGTRNEL